MIRKNTKGFTLIELMVVISIIGVLSSVVMAGLSSARAKAGDSANVQRMKQIQTAIELYREDNGSYPTTGGNFQYNGYNTGGNLTPVFQSLISGGYISDIKTSNPPAISNESIGYISPVGTWSCVNGPDNPSYLLVSFQENLPSNGPHLQLYIPGLGFYEAPAYICVSN